MASYLGRLRSAVRGLLGGEATRPAAPGPQPAAPAAAPSTVVAIGNNLALADGRLTFADEGQALARPESWLDVVEAAQARGAALADGAIEVLRRLAAPGAAQTLLPSDASRARLMALLRPAPGVAARLEELDRAGLLAPLLGAAGRAQSRPAIEHLERLAGEPSLANERFASLLRELRSPEILVLAELSSNGLPEERRGEQAQAVAEAVASRLGLRGEAREMLEFLLRERRQMPLVAFRQDTGDPAVVNRFAALFTAPGPGERDAPEEHLKMLCLLTVADLGARGPGALTPWKAEVVWRLFVDTYNAITMSYGDEVIARDEAAIASLKANRPHDIDEPELVAFLDGLPQRYLSLFDADSIFQHARLARRIGPDDIHSFLKQRSDVWELTVVTLDKPFLFSNVCGVLSYSGFDILRGQALTSRHGLVLDVFQFTDHKGCLARPQLEPLLSEVVAGRRAIDGLLDQTPIGRPAGGGASAPVIYFDNESSARYTILELVADDAPGLLYRISRVLSRHQCSIELTLISTEGGKAFDVFHVRKGEAKLSDSDASQLTEDFERTLGPTPERPAGQPAVDGA